MLRRTGSVVGVLLLVLVGAVSVIVLGIRTKYPPVVDLVRRFARDIGNPRQLKSAGARGSRAAVLRHTGRKSGKAYETPITAMPTADGFLIALPYGPNTDWLKNVLAQGSTVLVHEGITHRVDEPEVVPSALATQDLSAGERRALRFMGVDQFLRLHRAQPA